MKTVKVKNLTIGEGIPKICVPIVGVTKEEILEEARTVAGLPADLVEWRVDWFEDALVEDKVVAVLQELREALGEIPILFTFRTKNEGGEKSIAQERYVSLLMCAAKSKLVDLIDVEVFFGDFIRQLIVDVHNTGTKVVGSNHDFAKTPPKEEIINRLKAMQEMGADIPKLAVMPQCEEDVEILTGATKEMVERYADRPIVTMSMGELGKPSRIEGELFGSAITFGSAKKASAPGQIEVIALRKHLEEIHKKRVEK